MSKNQEGVLTIPMALSILIIATSGLTLWGMLRHWKNLAETQLRLDRCAGQTAQELRDTLSSLESSNFRIKGLRIARGATAIAPPVSAALEIALLAQVAIQEIQRAKWEVTRLRWLTHLRCGSLKDMPSPLPSMKWLRDPPDAIGPNALRWEGEWPKDFQIQVTHYPRAAGARVFYSTQTVKEELLDQHNWKTEWF